MNLDGATFIDALWESTGRADPPIEDRLWTATEVAVVVYSQLAVDARSLATSLGGAVVAAAESPHGLESIRVQDLYLATAMAGGDPNALAFFEERLMPVVVRALRRFGLGPDERTEQCQRVQIRLLVPNTTTPARISSYAGLGKLDSWLRTIADRLAVSSQRQERDHESLEEVPDFALGGTPEAAVLRNEERALFLGSLQQAFGELERSDRTLLRLRYAEDMTLASLAQAYGLHESTMSRRLAPTRRTVAKSFRRLAGERLGTTATADALGLAQSRIETSLETLLASRDGG